MWLDVTDPTYGADGTDVLDDSAAIQSAINAAAAGGNAATIYFPGAGTYYARNLSVGSGADIRFYGPHATLKYFGDTGSGSSDAYASTGTLLHAQYPRRFRMHFRKVDGNAAVTGKDAAALVLVRTATDGSTELIEIVGDWVGGSMEADRLLIVINDSPGDDGAASVRLRDGRWSEPSTNGFFMIRGRHQEVIMENIQLTDPNKVCLAGVGHLCDFASNVSTAPYSDAMHRVTVRNVASKYSMTDVLFFQSIMHLSVDGVVIESQGYAADGSFTSPGGPGIKTDYYYFDEMQSVQINNVIARNTNMASPKNIWITEGSRKAQLSRLDIDGDLSLSSSGAGDESYQHTVRGAIIRGTGRLIPGRYSLLQDIELIGPIGGSTLVDKLQIDRDVTIDGLRLENYARLFIPSTSAQPYDGITILNVSADSTSDIRFQRSNLSDVQDVTVRNWVGGAFDFPNSTNIGPNLRLTLSDVSAKWPTASLARQRVFENATYEGHNVRHWNGTKFVTDIPDKTRSGPTITTSGAGMTLSTDDAETTWSPGTPSTVASISGLFDGQETILTITNSNGTITTSALANIASSIVGPTILRIRRVGSAYFKV